MTMQNSTDSNRDFKYVLEDFSRVYIGARLTFQELMECEDAPMKLRSIVMHYMTKENSADTTLAEHVLHLKKGDPSYLILKQMKAVFRVNVPEENKKGAVIYKAKEMSMDALMDSEAIQKYGESMVIEEMILSKLWLAAVSV